MASPSPLMPITPPPATSGSASAAKRRGAASLPPAQRSSLARIGAYALHAQYDARDTTRGAREAKLRKWREQVDPTGALAQRDPQELERRVKACQALEMEKVRFAKMRKAQARKEEEARQQQKQQAIQAQNETEATSIDVEVAPSSPTEQTVTKALGGDAIVTRRQGQSASDARRADTGTTQPRARNSKKAAYTHGDSHTTPHTR